MGLDNYQVFFIGCVGAIAPEILRLYRLRNTLAFSWSWSYILISIAFVLLGGFVSYILEPSNNYAAFYSGVGTPFIINAIAKETQTQAIPAPQLATKPTQTDQEDEITRAGKGISKSEEESTLSKADQNLKKMCLSNYFRAL